MRGHIDIPTVAGRALRGNPLKDPAARRIPIYCPPSYARATTRRYPVIYYLPGYTGFGEACLNVGAWSESLPQRVDRLIRAGRMREAIVVMCDGFTAYGGSQYINSSATGRYMDYLVDELVPWIDRHYRTHARAGARAIMGKSSGGFGALTIAMRRPGVFGAVAAHSSDMYFEYCYKSDFPKALTTFDRHGRSLTRFLRAWRTAPKRLAGGFASTINLIAMASCYSPNRRAPFGFDLPVDLQTGAVRPDVWRRWLTWDPVVAVRRYARNLRGLRFLYLDVGMTDEYHLHYGHRYLTDELRRLGIRHHYEEFDDGHRDTQYRLDRSLPLLARHLT